MDKFIQFSDHNPDNQFETSSGGYGKELGERRDVARLNEFNVKLNLHGEGDILRHGLRHGAGYSNMKHKITYVI